MNLAAAKSIAAIQGGGRIRSTLISLIHTRKNTDATGVTKPM
jgi:hypothetical protein